MSWILDQLSLPKGQKRNTRQIMGSCSSKSGDPYHWGYIDDGKGWTARPRSEYMKTPAYNKHLRRQMREESHARGGNGHISMAEQSRKQW
ncbi:hypothetical protein COL26b_011479 [Colletotrichum chrysophilum]|uniref:uncharacterized protein n=1 Tax=Colletotrichum chrysophilum TaxID=1836956 RepID=UPI0023006960|nr:uncharacterized protein COL26b_011479 [Colletotrichum chrysophilum]KAJ0366891.1 hypothetical protein COL26b_011479 [Colletotrichum chrysophilum]